MIIYIDVCPVCNYSHGIVGEIDALGHDEGEWVVTVPSTCTEAGEKIFACTVCAAPIKSEAIPATGHVAGAFVETKAATCTVAGEKTQYCEVCAIPLATEVIDPYGHNESGYKITIYADCVNYGEAITYCTTCENMVSTKVLEPIGHKPGPAHNCSEDQVCLTCGEVIVPADHLSHVWSDWTVFKGETCFKDRIESRFCVKCFLVDYQEIPYTAKCHQYWPHNEAAEDCGCTACDILNAIQGAFKNLNFGLWFVLTQNIVTELLFPWFL